MGGAEVTVSIDSRFCSGSIGKTFVPMVALALEHEGVLSLDEPIASYVGGTDYFGRLPNRKGMTLRHLLTHSAGLIDHVMAMSYQDVRGEDPDAYLTPRQ